MTHLPFSVLYVTDLVKKPAHVPRSSSPLPDLSVVFLASASLFLCTRVSYKWMWALRQQQMLHSVLLINSVFLIFSRETGSMSGQESRHLWQGRHRVQHSVTGSLWKQTLSCSRHTGRSLESPSEKRLRSPLCPSRDHQ